MKRRTNCFRIRESADTLSVVSARRSQDACRSAAGACHRGRLVVFGGSATAADSGFRIVAEVLRAGAEGVGVGEFRVDLPLLPGWTGDPHLVLRGEATGGAEFLVGEQSFA